MKRLLKITAMTGGMTLIKMLMGFFIAKVIAIYTGPAGMAMLGQVQSVINGLNGVINAPAGNGIVKYTAENRSDYKQCSPWWRASLYWIGILSLLLIPLGCIFSRNISSWVLHNDKYYWIIVAVLLSLPLTAVGTLIISVLNGLQNYKRYAITGIISAVVSGIMMILMIIYWGLNGALLTAAIQYAMIGGLALAMNFRQAWIKLTYWTGEISLKAKKDIAEYIFMAVVSAIALPIALVFIRNFLIKYVGWAGTGEWQAVWRISEVYLGVITMALSTYYLPKIASMKDPLVIKSEINRTAIIIFPIVLLMAAGIYLSRDYIITILFTEEFREARNLFLIQLIGDVIKIASWLYAYPMLAKKTTKWFVFSEVVFTLTWVILSYYLINIYGVHGANLAYCINYALYFIFVFFNINRIIK